MYYKYCADKNNVYYSVPKYRCPKSDGTIEWISEVRIFTPGYLDLIALKPIDTQNNKNVLFK